MFSLKADLDLLENKIVELANVRLVVIDPISAYMGGADGNGNVETRELLEPLWNSQTDVGLRSSLLHTSTRVAARSGKVPFIALSARIAFAAAARAAFVVVQDADNEENRLFLQVKNNLGPRCDGLSFCIEQQEWRSTAKRPPKVVWGNEYVAHSADDALAAGGGHAAGDLSKSAAITFLRTLLADGPIPVMEVQRHAIEAGLLQEGKLISQSKPFRSAGSTLGIKHKRDGGRWVLELPCKLPFDHQDAPASETDISSLGESLQRSNSVVTR